MQKKIIINVICAVTIFILGAVMPNFTAYGEVIKYVRGDMNDDAKVNALDLSLLKRKVAGLLEEETDRVILDAGVCGENLTWALYDDGLLKISGTGRSYDYCKGLFGDDVTRAEIEEYQAALEGKTDLDSIAKYERGFQEGKVYDHENGQYVAPWYKYRKETLISADGTRILNPDGTTYMSVSDYNKDNPNGWTYNRIEIDPGVTYIGNWFFYRVCGPTQLILPDTVKEIGQWSIRFSPTLKYVYLPDSVEIIEKRGCSRLEVVEEIRTSNGLKFLGDYAFAQNNALTRLVVNGNIEEMGTYCFGYNNALEYVEFTGLEHLSSAQFVDCNNLKEVVFSQSLQIIEKTALVNRPIKVVKIPSNVSEIGESAFYGCVNLDTVYVDSPIIAKNLKYSSSCGHVVNYANKIYINSEITEIGKYLCENFDVIPLDNGYTLYTKKQ